MNWEWKWIGSGTKVFHAFLPRNMSVQIQGSACGMVRLNHSTGGITNLKLPKCRSCEKLIKKRQEAFAKRPHMTYTGHPLSVNSFETVIQTLTEDGVPEGGVRHLFLVNGKLDPMYGLYTLMWQTLPDNIKALRRAEYEALTMDTAKKNLTVREWARENGWEVRKFGGRHFEVHHKSGKYFTVPGDDSKVKYFNSEREALYSLGALKERSETV